MIIKRRARANFAPKSFSFTDPRATPEPVRPPTFSVPKPARDEDLQSGLVPVVQERVLVVGYLHGGPMVWPFRTKKREASPSSTPTKRRPQKRASAAPDTPSDPHAAAAGLATPPGPSRAPKKAKTSSIGQVPCYQLRSGPVIRHPLVIAAATMQIESMSCFQLAAPESPSSRSTSSSVLVPSQSSEAASTDPSILAIWSQPNSQTDSLSEARTSGLSTPVSDATTWAPWMPQTPASSRGGSSPSPARRDISAYFTSGRTPSPIQLRSPSARFRAPRTPPGEIPRWFEEAFESEGYDSDALELIAGLRPSRRPRVIEDNVGAEPRHSASDVSIALHERAEGGQVVDGCVDAAQHPSRGLLPCEVWTPEPWPDDVRLLREQWNPSHWRFEPVSRGVRGGVGCGCEAPCSAPTCANTKESRFCTDENCSYAGSCGNALLEHPSLVIARSSLTGMRGLVAKDPIQAGVVLGEYLGHLDLFGPECRNGPVNEGYRMHLKTRSTGGKYLGIDAKDMGGKLRMLNHACNPVARFHEVQTGDRLTVVAATIRDVAAGEQVTVSYGDCLWFICRCGWSGCQHRDLQHLLDVDERTE